tara:strand:+ start:1742 stop:2080 length:339 start_codon:yes stop_codon:yes gene_type:complete
MAKAKPHNWRKYNSWRMNENSVDDLLSEKKMFDEKNIRKAMKMKPMEARIFLSTMINDKKLTAAFEGLKDISNVIVPNKEIEQKLDIKLKTALEKTYANAEEVKGNIKLFGM